MTEQKYTGFKEFGFSLGKETLLTSWELVKITIPVLIVTKVLDEAGVINHLSVFLEPVMNLIGLPGALGLVWATAMLTTLYGGIAVFAALAPGLDLSVAEVTVLCSAMLIAHSLPLELSVSHKAGANMLPIGILRGGGAIVYAFLLDRLCVFLGIWQQQAELLFTASGNVLSLPAWVWQQIQNIGLIILIIFGIVVAMRLLRLAGILTLLEKLLAPVLPKFGMGRKAAPITVVGMIMGIGYGGALIIREISSGEMEKKEIFNSMALMGLCHGLVEDTLLMAAIGGKLGGIFWGRIVFSLIVIYALVKLLDSFIRTVNHQTP
jgi:hypothetical protein